jgi:hypothetical protein
MPKATPVLKGRDARRFAESLRNPKPVGREEYLRAERIYRAVKVSNGPSE